MRRIRILSSFLALAALVLAAGCSTQPTAVKVDPEKLKVFGVLPAAMESAGNPITDAKITLGRMLYYDTRLSKNKDVACNTCHMLDKYGVDSEATSTGHNKQKGNRNAPTVYNAAGHFVQFWDGRAANVEEQAKGPVMNPVEMAMPNDKSVVRVLSGVPEYVALFKKAFPDDKQPVSFDNMAKAIAAFERKLVTPSRWDKFLAGDQTALTEEEKAGLNKFLETGCQTCHLGPYVGGEIYQRLGMTKAWTNSADLGRFNVTKQDSDKMRFKVPSLRNIEKTGPYFHDGSVTTLDEAVKLMSDYQLGKQLSDADTKAIVAFLKSMTGDLPMDYIKMPEMPKGKTAGI